VFYSLQWLCFFAGAAFLINFCHWTWFADAYLTQKISSSVTTVYMITKNNVLNPVDNTLRFLWAGLEPNYFAASLIFPLFASTGFAFHSAKGWRFVWLTIVSLCILGLVGTYSRSAFILTGIFLILLLLMFKKESVFKIIVFAFGLIILISNIPSIQDRFLSIEENIIYEGGSGRLERSLAGLKLYFEQPLGRGLGSSNSLFSKNDYLGVEGSHNTYLLVLLETGPHGLLLFLSIILLGISGFFRAKMLFCVTDIKMRLLLNSIIFGSIASAVFVATIPMGDYKFFFLPSIFGYSLYHFVLSNTNSNLLPIPQVSRKI
jgi:O-antigen ligase